MQMVTEYVHPSSQYMWEAAKKLWFWYGNDDEFYVFPFLCSMWLCFLSFFFFPRFFFLFSSLIAKILCIEIWCPRIIYPCILLPGYCSSICFYVDDCGANLDWHGKESYWFITGGSGMDSYIVVLLYMFCHNIFSKLLNFLTLYYWILDCSSRSWIHVFPILFILHFLM